MSAHSNNSVRFTEAEQFEYPPPARFDESASANAQPVQPLSTSRVAAWKQRARSARELISSKTVVLVLVVIGGLAIGALGGTLLVRHHTSMTESAPVVEESTLEIPAEGDSQKPADETRAGLPTTELSNAGRNSARGRNRRTRPNTWHAQRAYRVAVIR
jgi:hypothetical protein